MAFPYTVRVNSDNIHWYAGIITNHPEKLPGNNVKETGFSVDYEPDANKGSILFKANSDSLKWPPCLVGHFIHFFY
jgi:hypothetical protein